MPGAASEAVRWLGEELPGQATAAMLRPLQMLAAAPSYLFLLTLTAMLLRHPDVRLYQIDRVAFGLLIAGVAARSVVSGQRLVAIEGASWPMIGLTLLALISLAGQSFDREAWNLLASKCIVPFTLFHLSGLVFNEEKYFRRFEIFAVTVLAYLSFTAIAFFCGMDWLIYPKIILDDALGFHADRARGPLLQAVANGVSLNLLGILGWHAYRRRRMRGAKAAVLLLSVPIAILATMTRTVWVTFAGTVLALIVLSKSRALLVTGIALAAAATVGLAILAGTTQFSGTLNDRLQERGPVDYRAAVYAGGWEMFQQRPWLGWGFHQMPAELPRHVSEYSEKILYPHNTYLELLAEHGIVGLALYVCLMWELWRLGRGRIPAGEERGFLNAGFHRLWPVLLLVYWINAAVVVMSYQFVNGLLYSMAGMLAAQGRRGEVARAC
jgi:putative inorganic carbon (HCO3(-)) transporter